MASQIEYPLISVGIPTYNRSVGILRTLNSIWAQQYPNLEVVISDNCSTDDTQEVIQQVSKEHPEIKFHHLERAGFHF